MNKLTEHLGVKEIPSVSGPDFGVGGGGQEAQASHHAEAPIRKRKNCLCKTYIAKKVTFLCGKFSPLPSIGLQASHLAKSGPTQ